MLKVVAFLLCLNLKKSPAIWCGLDDRKRLATK